MSDTKPSQPLQLALFTNVAISLLYFQKYYNYSLIHYFLYKHRMNQTMMMMTRTMTPLTGIMTPPTTRRPMMIQMMICPPLVQEGQY